MTVTATCNHCRHQWPYDGTERTCPNCGEEPETKPGGGGKRNKNHHRGKRTIGDKTINFPNRWEANYYRYLHWLRENDKIMSYLYQPCYFAFPIQHGITRYRPDFYIADMNGKTHYVEIKGYMDSASKTKLNRMKQFFPNVELRLVTATEMRHLNNTVGKIIEGWER